MVSAQSVNSVRNRYYSRLGISKWNRSNESVQEDWKNFVRPKVPANARNARMIMAQLRQKVDNHASKECFLSGLPTSRNLDVECDLPLISRSVARHFVYQGIHSNGIEEWSRYKPGEIAKGDCLTISEMVAIALYHRGYPIDEIQVIKTSIPVKIPAENLKVYRDTSNHHATDRLFKFDYHAWIKCSGFEYEPLFDRRLDQSMWIPA